MSRSPFSGVWFTAVLALAVSSRLVGASEVGRSFAVFSGPSKLTVPLVLSREGKPVVSVQVMGRPRNLFIDTGATTILDVEVARELGLDPVETVDGATGLTGVAGRRWVAVVTLKIGELSITDYPISCLDLSALRALNRSQGLPVLDGLIGADLLKLLRARLDYERLELTLRRPTAAQFKPE